MRAALLLLILLLLPLLLLLLLLLGVLDESPGPPSLFFRRERMRARWSPCDEVGVAVAVAVAVAMGVAARKLSIASPCCLFETGFITYYKNRV